MTLSQAIARLDALKPNTFTDAEKLRWLSALDGRIHAELIGEGGEPFRSYTERTPPETELAVPFPYDALYLHYLEMRVDYANEDYTKYNNSSAMFNESYAAFERYYNRTHRKTGRTWKIFS